MTRASASHADLLAGAAASRSARPRSRSARPAADPAGEHSRRAEGSAQGASGHPGQRRRRAARNDAVQIRAAPKQPKPKPVARPKQPPAATATDAPPAVAVPVMPRLRHRRRAAEQSALPSAVAAPIEPPAASNGREDAAYAAFQRGHYLTAFTIATERVEKHDDVKAMALLGELYAAGLGVMQDDDQGRRLVPARRRSRRPRGDVRARDAAHGRPRRAGQSRRGRQAARRRGAARASDGVLQSRAALSRRPVVPADFARAAELFRVAAEAGSPEAQYALATLYKEGRGVTQGRRRSRRGCSISRRSPTTPTRRSSMAIALFNGTGVAKNEQSAARFLHARARKGSPIAQNRLAHILAAGRGMPADPVEAIKWHLISKAGGASDQKLDAFMRTQKPETIAAADQGGAAVDRGASGSPASRALDAAACGGQTHALAPVAMLRSALLNVMIKAARKAGAHAQARLRRGRASAGVAQGAGQFRHRRRPQGGRDPARGIDHGASRLRLPRRGRRPPRGHRQDPHLGGRSARRHLELRARHPAFRDLDRARARRHRRRRA